MSNHRERMNALPSPGRGLLAALALAMLPSIAFTHPGDHSGMSFTQGLQHMLDQPDHLGLLGLIVLVVALGAGGAFSRRAPK